jgi:hypothetical protein
MHKWFSKNFISLWKSGCYTDATHGVPVRSSRSCTARPAWTLWQPGWADHARPAWPFGLPRGMGCHCARTKPWARFWPNTILWLFFRNHLSISRNSLKLPKFIENRRSFTKILNKFVCNPCEYILVIGLTKFPFVLYCLIENSYKSNIGVFNYKNTWKVKCPNIAYMCTSWSLAYTKFLIFISYSN